MKQWSVIIASLLVSGSALAADESYHFTTYLFQPEAVYAVVNGVNTIVRRASEQVGEGDGNPEVCKHLFVPPMAYNGRYFPIGTNATVFGVLAVTDGRTAKIIALFKWIDEKGKRHYACNGPTPWYARSEDSQDALLKTIVEAIEKK